MIRNYEFMVLPFELTNASVAFMCLITRMFNKFLDIFVLIFIDEILVYSNTLEEHKYHFQIVV